MDNTDQAALDAIHEGATCGICDAPATGWLREMELESGEWTGCYLYRCAAHAMG